MQPKWSNPDQKQSHEGKSVTRHINEIKSLLRNYLEFYDFERKYFDLAEFLAEYHDAGKLHANWNLGSREGHTHHSLEYLIEKKIFFHDRTIDPLIKFLILKHHSTLSETIKDRILELNGKKWSVKTVFNVMIRKQLEDVLDSMSVEEKVNLIDAFGLFKLADACSAANKDIKFKTPRVSEEIVKRIIAKKVQKVRWNEQTKLISLPDVSMLRAYTGWGKTDVSLLFFKNRKVSKVFYLFPTITAINKFFEKLRKAAGNNVSKYFYFLDTELKEEQEKLSNLFFIENFTASYNLTTIDQFLLSFLQVGKYYTKRAMFRDSGLIVDEAHLLNPLMLDLLSYFIRKYAKVYHIKVLFMSATLPKSLAQYLQDNFEIRSFLDCSEGYRNRKRIMWKYEGEDIEDSVEKIVNRKKDGEKVLVIVNTVEKAIEIGKKLENEFKLNYGEDFIVFHARFMYKHRKQKEDWFTKNAKRPHVVVATQVCEVSLDISYDALFMELASIPAMIQRFGRVNRYGKETKKVNVCIFRPWIRDPRRYPYSEDELKTAEDLVRKFEGEKLIDEKQLIDEMDSILSYEKLQKEIESAKKEVNMRYWENLMKFFYSFEIKDDKVANLLNYREGFTTLIIPHPNCIFENTKTHVTELLSKSFFNLPFVEQKRLIAAIKEITVPIPIWWLKNAKQEEGIFPLVDFKEKIYDYKYGFHTREGK